MKSLEFVAGLFKEAERDGRVHSYKKYGVVQVKLANVGERIVTIINGKKETENVATEGSVIVVNPGGERYIISRNKFDERYKGTPTKEWTTAIAKGRCRAFRYTGDSFSFLAPWEEKMIVDSGDYIVQSKEGDYNDIYRIAQEAFKQTYKRDNHV